MNRAVGFSLVELMLALVLALLISHIVTIFYFSIQHHFRLQHEISNVQDEAYDALYFIANEIKMAGYIGCAKLTSDNSVKHFQQYSITPENKLTYKKGELVSRHANRLQVHLMQAMHQADEMDVSHDIRFSPGDIVVISDCESAEIFQIKTILIFSHYQKIISTHPLAKFYKKNANVSLFEINTFYFKEPEQSLLMTTINHEAAELANNIKEINMFFDVIERGELIEKPSLSSADSRNVKGVSIELAFDSFKKIVKYVWLKNA